MARKLLNNLFGINDTFKRMKLDKTKGILIFDDNIAGGATLDAICLAVEKLGFEKNNIMPISFGIMPISFGIMNHSTAIGASQGEKQGFRNKYMKDNGYTMPEYFNEPDKQIEYYD